MIYTIGYALIAHSKEVSQLEATNVDGERLVRLEAQIESIGRDMTELKGSIATFLTNLGSMHIDYVPRKEIDKQNELRDKQIEKLEIDIQENAKDIDSLKDKWLSRPTWGVTMTFTGGGSLITGLIIYILTGHAH